MIQLRFALATALLGIALSSTACFRQDKRTITVAVPQMKSPECYAVIQQALGGVEGIEGSRPNYEQRTLDVTYNGLKLAIKNVEFVIAGAGFDANNTAAPADAKARLPEGCR